MMSNGTFDAVRQGEVGFAAAIMRGDGASEQQRAAIADFNHRGLFGETVAARAARQDSEAFRTKALRDYDECGPPAGIKADTRGMKPMRARLARFLAWKNQTADELANLEAARVRLEATIEAPVAAEAKRRGLLQEQASRLLEAIIGFGQREADSPGFDVVQRRALDSEIDVVAHKADVARVALNDVADKIATKQIQIERLRQRQRYFVEDALKEHAESYLGIEYLKAIDQLRPVLVKLFGLRTYLGLTGPVEYVEFPRFGLTAFADNEDALCIAPGRDSANPWIDLVKSWGA
jgi:hypothetical protein